MSKEKPVVWFDSFEAYKASPIGIQGCSREQLEAGLNAWVAAGRPIVWVLMESHYPGGMAEPVHCYYDFGYGGIMLKIGDKTEVGYGNIIHLDGYVALHKEYYGVSKYIWS